MAHPVGYHQAFFLLPSPHLQGIDFEWITLVNTSPEGFIFYAVAINILLKKRSRNSHLSLRDNPLLKLFLNTFQMQWLH